MKRQHEYIKGVLERWGERRGQVIRELGYPVPNFTPGSHQKGVPPQFPGWKPNEFLLKVEIVVMSLPKTQKLTAINIFERGYKPEELAIYERKSRSAIDSRLTEIYKNVIISLKKLRIGEN